MLILKAQDKKLSKFSDIDRFALIPKKWWKEFEVGDNSISINDKAVKVRVYEIPCTCVGDQHIHMIVDLRDVWDNLQLTNKQQIEINK